MIKRFETAAISIAASLIGSPALAEPEPEPAREPGIETSIPYNNAYSIRNYEGDEDRGIWIQDIRGLWYYGTFVGPCAGVNYAMAVGFDTRGSSRLDRSARVIVEGNVCTLSSLVTAEKPLSRKERKRLRRAVSGAQ